MGSTTEWIRSRLLTREIPLKTSRTVFFLCAYTILCGVLHSPLGESLFRAARILFGLLGRATSTSPLPGRHGQNATMIRPWSIRGTLPFSFDWGSYHIPCGTNVAITTLASLSSISWRLGEYKKLFAKGKRCSIGLISVVKRHRKPCWRCRMKSSQSLKIYGTRLFMSGSVGNLWD